MTDEQRPAPPVPSGCDLRDFAFVPLEVRRLRDSDIAAIDDAEGFRGAVLLWCAAWHQLPPASLPNDDKAICRLAGYGRDLKTWQRAKAAGALRGFVECSDGRLYHLVLAEKALEAWGTKLDRLHRTEAATEARRIRREHTADVQRAKQRDDQRDVKRDDQRNVVQGKGREGKGSNTTSKAMSDSPKSPANADVNPPTLNGQTAELRKQAGEVLEFLNEKTGRAFRPVNANLGPIMARMKEGATVRELRAVIARKCREWGSDEKMAEYLRPLTLFSATKFAQYVGDVPREELTEGNPSAPMP